MVVSLHYDDYSLRKQFRPGSGYELFASSLALLTNGLSGEKKYLGSVGHDTKFCFCCCIASRIASRPR